VENILSQISFSPLTLNLVDIQVLPNENYVRVICCAIKGDIDALADVQKNLRIKLREKGFKVDKRKFKPHLTLGRFKKSSEKESSLIQLLDKYRDLKSPVEKLDELVFFRSDLNHSGAKYTRLSSWHLIESSQ